MLKKKHKFVFLLILVVSLGLFTLLMGQNSPKISTTQKRDIKVEDLINQAENSTPTVEYYSPTKKPQGIKYNSIDVLNPAITKDDIEVVHLDWEVNLSALPITQSQLVIVGKVSASKAYLSENNSSVYSEFDIKVEKIYQKNNQSFNSRTIKAERMGGIVHYPAGYRSLFKVAGQNMPKINTRYLFFLTHDFPVIGNQDKEYYLLTGYELTDDKVFPLDNPQGGTHPLSLIYKEKTESHLLEDLQNLIKRTNKNLQK